MCLTYKQSRVIILTKSDLPPQFNFKNTHRILSIFETYSPLSNDDHQSISFAGGGVLLCGGGVSITNIGKPGSAEGKEVDDHRGLSRCR